ncbi:MAG: Gfo/Idh/MocA family oxidoreductase [Acidobacteria bacterium]|nr:Gfo/Idh/MocA family oxidoreductase [Planctomycetota bacterium]MBE3133123.1 Gfo/Idh/MocA family oxidoreductase [Acidobacteriota bacterium]
MINRRTFLTRTAAAGAAAALAPLVVRAEAPPPSNDLRVALIGAGKHGRDLVNYALDIPGVRFAAVSDIWPYSRDYAARLLKKRGHEVVACEDYREMLGAAKDLQAALVVTPDAFHADQAVDCLKAGLHVFCEKEMHHTLAGARRMVLAARETGKLLQVGRQHRSNPRYHAALDLLDAKKAVGRPLHVCGQWHGHKRVPFKWPEKYKLDDAVLAKYGYESMQQFRDWRWSAKFSAGPIANLGSHQIDVFNWFLHAVPKAVSASGGRDYYDFYDWYDNVSCVFEWDYARDGKTSAVRGDYNILTYTDDGGFYECVTGNEGALEISEDPARGGIRRESDAPEADWEKALTATPPGRRYPPVPAGADDKGPHWHHLKNFFDAVRGQAKLTCPADVAYQATVSALKVNEAMKAGARLEYKPEEFTV